MNHTQVFRPKLAWRVFAPLAALSCLTVLIFGGLSSDDRFYFTLASSTLLIWTIFLWTARLRIDNGRIVTICYLGRCKRPVDLGAVQEKYLRKDYSFPFPSMVIIVRDTQGNGLMLTRSLWDGWDAVRQIIAG